MMDVLQVLNTIYTRLADPGAIVRIDMDQEDHGERCKVVVISRGVYAAGIVDVADWANPDEIISAMLAYHAAAAGILTK